MLVFRRTSDLHSWLSFQKSSTQSIGFVPTMGALHAGHISLIQRSKKENDITVCSIFVNPTQFNDPKDLEKYPRTLPADSLLLSQAQCDVLFFPSKEEIYPKDLKEIFVDLNGLDLVMEGTHRPGHFKGVVQVVHRLLDIVQPERLYMGQKDFQQFTIIASMIEYLNLPVKLVVCPTCRESNGLAMSSRNERLSTPGRSIAAEIYRTLSLVTELKKTMTPEQVSTYCLDAISHEPFKPEYVTIAAINTLRPIQTWGADGSNVLCIAVWLEGVRLIDNVII